MFWTGTSECDACGWGVGAAHVDALAAKGERESVVMFWNHHDVDGPAAGMPIAVTVGSASGGPESAG